jgi:hypothetical protein
MTKKVWQNTAGAALPDWAEASAITEHDRETAIPEGYWLVREEEEDGSATTHCLSPDDYEERHG